MADFSTKNETKADTAFVRVMSPINMMKSLGAPYKLPAYGVGLGALVDYDHPPILAIHITSPVGSALTANLSLGQLTVEVVYRLEYRTQ